MVPFIDETVILGGFYTPGVGIVDSLQAGTLMRQKAQEMGALTVAASVEVTGIDVEAGRVRRVHTDARHDRGRTSSSSPAASGARGSRGWPAPRSR